MTNEEAKRRLEVWLKCMDCPEDKQCYDSHLHSTCEYTDYCDETPVSEAVKVAIKALEQQPCDDEYIKIPKKALKYRTAGMVAYNAEWLKKHWQMELKVMGIECDDAISREAVYSILNEHHIDEDRIKSDMDERQNLTVNSIASDVSLLPSVTQKSAESEDKTE